MAFACARTDGKTWTGMASETVENIGCTGDLHAESTHATSIFMITKCPHFPCSPFRLISSFHQLRHVLRDSFSHIPSLVNCASPRSVWSLAAPNSQNRRISSVHTSAEFCWHRYTQHGITPWTSRVDMGKEKLNQMRYDELRISTQVSPVLHFWTKQDGRVVASHLQTTGEDRLLTTTYVRQFLRTCST